MIYAYTIMIVSGCNSNQVRAPNGRCFSKALFEGNSIRCVQKGGGRDVGGCDGKCPM